MKKLCAILVMTMLCMALVFSTERLAALLETSPENAVTDLSFDMMRHSVLEDAVPTSGKTTEYMEMSEMSRYQPLEVHRSSDPAFDYMAVSPYYKVFFRGTTAKMNVENAWIEFELTELKGIDCTECGSQEGLSANLKPAAQQNTFSVSNVLTSVDLSYTVDTSVLKEAFILREPTPLERIVLKISWEGMNPEFQDDGSILFLNEKEILKILPPFMRDATGAVCEDVHYELRETETGYELHKVIDENGLEWLKKAVYPVLIDPSVETFEDAWESSGLTPYGQYFENLEEFVSPATGYLTITQKDLTIPGRGLDLEISRIYETPAVFYEDDPYDYEAPPVNVGKGWQLDFPYVGEKYLHLWGGSIYKIEWSDNTFENHVGAHFVLVKNGDDTYTLTLANGIVCTFSTSGKLTKIEDIDQNAITFSYSSGKLTTITDTIGRTVTLTYSGNYLQKITYNSAELEYGYDGTGRLTWMDDFLNRRTSYTYSSSVVWLLSKIEYPTTGYTEYYYDKYSDSDYHKYHVTNRKIYETSQVNHTAFSYTGSFSGIASCTATVKNESDTTKGSYVFSVSDAVITQRVIKNASGTPLKKHKYTYDSAKQVTQVEAYGDGTTLSYTAYYAYDSWGNIIYAKDGEDHERFFSYANTSTAGFFVDNTGAVIQKFTNAFSNSTVPSSVHTALIGLAEKQDSTYVKEMYVTYDSEAHPTQKKNFFGNATTWVTFSGTFNEETSDTSFTIDLTGHTVVGNAVLKATGNQSDDTLEEDHSYECPCNPTIECTWSGGYWSDDYYKVHWIYGAGDPIEYTDGWASIGPFTHHPGTLGYQSYTTDPSLGEKAHTFAVTTYWKAYPAQVEYNVDGAAWDVVTSDLSNGTAMIPVTITGGSHTLNLSESSSYQTKFSWWLYVPVDNTLDDYTISMTYDTYGNVTSVTDAESNTVTFTYSSSYSYAYVTGISATVDSNTVTTEATYDYYRGWITSVQEPKGVDASSGYDYLYTYDLLGRVTKKEFPLLTGQSQRSYIEAVYDDTNRKVTVIDRLRHYIIKEYDKLERLKSTKWYTGTYGSGTLYATESYTYRYDNLLSTVTDPGNDTFTFTYDFLGRYTQVTYPDSSSVSLSYDGTNNKVTFTNGRGYDTVQWFDWNNRLTKLEEEYATDSFAQTTYQYDDVGNVVSVTDAENHTTTYTYASFFGLTKITYADSEYEEYDYDDVGNIISFTDCKGNETTYTFDDIYRVTQIQYEDQSTVSFTYDLNSNRTKMEDDAPSTGDYAEYAYDKWNRLTTKTRHISQDTYTVSYEYDTVGRLTELTYPDDMEILVSYDDLNRITQIKRYVDGENDEILMNNVQYNIESQLTQFDYGNGLRASYTYDARDRPVTMSVKRTFPIMPFLSLEFTYDNNNNATQIVNAWRDTSSSWNSETESYSYGGMDRLTSASCTSWSHSYSYDKVGNRTAKDSVTYTVNAVNEVTALSDGTSFTYDDNGNRTQKTKGTDTWDYTYDYADRLTKVEKNSSTLGEYVYDGDGRRLQKTENSTTTTYIQSGLTVLYEETSSGTACYIYGPEGILAKRTTINQESNTFYFHTDHLGSTRLVTDASKNVVSSASYHPFGESSTEEGSENYLYTGKEKDSTGLYYYGARYYDPALGSFLTRDPRGGINQYEYCHNNPVKYVDPDGCEPTNWIFPDYTYNPSTTVKKMHSHVIYWIGIEVESELWWFGVYCIGAGIILLIVAGGSLIVSGAAAHVVTALATASKEILSFVGLWLSVYWDEIVYQIWDTFGEDIIQEIFERIVLPALESLIKWIDKKTAEGCTFEKVMRVIGDITIISVITFDSEGKELFGSTTVLYGNGSSLTFMWMKSEDGAYLVFNPETEEWIPQDPDWEPQSGDPPNMGG